MRGDLILTLEYCPHVSGSADIEMQVRFAYKLRKLAHERAHNAKDPDLHILSPTVFQLQVHPTKLHCT